MVDQKVLFQFQVKFQVSSAPNQRLSSAEKGPVNYQWIQRVAVDMEVVAVAVAQRRPPNKATAQQVADLKTHNLAKIPPL
jgi:hypothetical protein